MGPSKELRIGVIGVGGRGGLARNAHRPEEGVRLVAGVDLREEALEKFRQDYGPDVFTSTDYRRLLERPDIDAVFITTPDYLHAAQAVAALEAGKAVYLEKPLAISIADCDRVLAVARDRGGKLYLGHNMRHMALIARMKELVDRGAIGEVKAGWCRHFVGYGGDAYFKDWHAERAGSNSLLLQKGAHDIDVLHWLCGGYTRRVTAMGGLTVYDRVKDRRPPGKRMEIAVDWSGENWPPLAQKGLNPVIEVEDLNMMLMELDNGVFASYQQCHYTPDSWRNYTIIGTEGRLENFGIEPGNAVIRLWNRRRGYNPYGEEQFYIPPAAGGHGGADPEIVAEFIRFVREGGKTVTSPVAARYSVAAGCLAAESLRSGGTPREVPPLPRELADYFDNPRF